MELEDFDKELLNYEDFFVYSWDYVSEKIVSDEYWSDNRELINDITFEVYNIYKNTFQQPLLLDVECRVLTPKIAGKLLEGIFDRIIKLGYKKVLD